MTEEEIDEMTVTDLLGAVQTKQQADFTATQRLQDQATSPLLGQAQRAEARAALRGRRLVGLSALRTLLKTFSSNSILPTLYKSDRTLCLWKSFLVMSILVA